MSSPLVQNCWLVGLVLLPEKTFSQLHFQLTVLSGKIYPALLLQNIQNEV